MGLHWIVCWFLQDTDLLRLLSPVQTIFDGRFGYQPLAWNWVQETACWPADYSFVHILLFPLKVGRPLLLNVLA